MARSGQKCVCLCRHIYSASFFLMGEERGTGRQFKQHSLTHPTITSRLGQRRHLLPPLATTTKKKPKSKIKGQKSTYPSFFFLLDVITRHLLCRNLDHPDIFLIDKKENTSQGSLHKLLPTPLVFVEFHRASLQQSWAGCCCWWWRFTCCA